MLKPSQSKNLSISVIVTTYNRPKALDCVLRSLSEQIQPPNEIIIADDGSGAETKTLIQAWQKKMPSSLIHCWQEDSGFRAAKVRNYAAMNSSSDYLIFLDGDCIVFSDFIERQIMLAEQKTMVIGSRILCSEDLTKSIESKEIQPSSWTYSDWLKARLSKKINRILPLFRLPNKTFRKVRKYRWQGIRTFNLAIWREDFFLVNGFDERFEGWGHEDADIAIRLIRSGVIRKDGQFSLPVLHLWHKENDRSRLKSNVDLITSTLNSNQIRAEMGLKPN